MLLADYESYISCQDKVSSLYAVIVYFVLIVFKQLTNLFNYKTCQEIECLLIL